MSNQTPEQIGETRKATVRITRNGYHLVFVCVFTILGSIVRDLNLLAVLSGLLLGVLIIQWRFSRGNLLGLRIARHVPREVFAGDAFVVRYATENYRSMLACWHLRIQDTLFRSSTRRIVAVAHAAIPNLSCGQREMARASCRVIERGQYRFESLRVGTEFPFGLTNTYCEFDFPETITVYPRLGQLKNNWCELIVRGPGSFNISRHSGSGEGDFFGIRHWHNGDSTRWIHWRTSARINDLAVRQFEQVHRNQFAILVDLHTGTHRRADFERLISFSATLLNDTMHNPMNQICVATSDGFIRSNILHRDFRERTFEQLAVIQPDGQQDFATPLMNLMEVCDISWPVLVLSLRCMPDDIISQLPPTVYRRANIHWINLMDDQVGQFFTEGSDEN